MKIILKALVVTMLLAAMTAVGCIQPSDAFVVTGSGNLETRTFDFTGFDQVEVGWAFEVTITAGTDYSVKVTADDNLFNYVDMRKTGNTLHVGMTGVRLYHNTTLRAEVTMPELRGLDLSGATRSTVSGFNTSAAVSFEVSGASTLGFDNTKVGDTDFEVSGASRVSGTITMEDSRMEVSGASRISLDGAAKDIVLEASGASRAEIPDLTAEDLRATVSGASEANVNVSGQLDCNLSGASRLFYHGNPRIGSLNVTGASSIGQK